MNWNANIPYNDLPLLPPAADLETRAVLKACIEARSALSALKHGAQLIPNPGILINTLPMLEARASSEIENIVTTTDELFKFREADDQADPATKEALRYSYALLHGFALMRQQPLSTRTAEMVCTEIKGLEMRVRNVAGTALAGSWSGEVIYTPPAGEPLLRDKLANWERFLHQATELDPLIRMAVGHYQFEAIHPFTDGNGRTGRVLNSLFLISEDLLTQPILYLSRYLIRHRPEYYRLLNEVTRNQVWEEWVLFMVKGVHETSLWTMRKIEAMKELLDHTTRFLKERLPKIYSYELATLIFAQPYCRIHNVEDAGIAKRETASRYLKLMVEVGVLEELVVGREKLFLHRKLLDLLSGEGNEFTPYP